MNRRGKRNIKLFFLECILVLFLFSLVSTVVIKAFIQADGIRVTSKDKIQGMTMLSNIAEKMQQVGEQQEMEESQNPQVLYYDKGWNPIEKQEENCFEIKMKKVDALQVGGNLQTIYLEANKIKNNQRKPVTQLTFKRYIPDYKK